MSIENLKLLETKIDEFVDRHERAQQEHEALMQRLKEKERQLGEVTAQLKQQEQERAEIKARLERILSRLDGLDLS